MPLTSSGHSHRGLQWEETHQKVETAHDQEKKIVEEVKLQKHQDDL